LIPPRIESPSLSAAGERVSPAFELKFFLDEARAGIVESWARSRLALDPHGDPALDGAYLTTSLCCDTLALDVYHRAPSYRRRKFRVRRYGTSSLVYLERKSKWGDRVAKERVPVPEEDLAYLAHRMSLVTWPGHWFHRGLLMRHLQPAGLVAYHRTAYVGQCPEGPLRLTLDRCLRGVLCGEWRPDPFEGGRLLTRQVILELKFRTALPAPFKELVERQQLSPTPVSKYRLCRDAWGLPPAQREAAHA
jgi:hypothetical protein